MVTEKAFLSHSLSCRRQFLGSAGAATLALTSVPALADTVVKLLLPGGPDERPVTTSFPQKGGADAINNNCLACQSADMVLNQPALSKAQWEAQVNLMRTAYKAPIDPKDAGAIVDYLVSIKCVK